MTSSRLNKRKGRVESKTLWVWQLGKSTYAETRGKEIETHTRASRGDGDKKKKRLAKRIPTVLTKTTK